MSMNRNFLFHLLRDNQIKLGCKYTVKDLLCLIELPLPQDVPPIYYQNQKHQIQEAHLSIFSAYDKKGEIPQFSISHITLAFKVTRYANSQIKVRIYLDISGQPQAVGEKNCTVKLITTGTPEEMFLDLGEEMETGLVETALSISQEIVESLYKNYAELIKEKQKAIDLLLQELNNPETSERRFFLLSQLKTECTWSEKYRPYDSIRGYNIHLKNFVSQELETIQSKKDNKNRNTVIESSLSETSSSSTIPALSTTARVQEQAVREPKRGKKDKVLEEIEKGRQGLAEARKTMEENCCFDTKYHFLKVISLQLETESLRLNDVEDILGMAIEARKCRQQLETLLGKAFYDYEDGKDKPDESKQFLKLPFSDLKQFIDGVDDMIFSHKVLTGLIKMRELEIFCQLLPHFHHLSLSATLVMHDHNLLLEAAKIADNDDLSCKFTQVVLSRGAKTNIYDRFSNSPLMWAVMLRNEKLVNLLLRYRADPNSCRRERIYRDNARDIKCAFFLKDKGYENKPAIYDLHTPLHAACLHRDDSIITTLLKHGANPTLQSADGFDALGYYCYYMPNIVEDPLYASTKVQYQFYNNISSRMPSQRPAANKDMVKKLIAYGCKIDEKQGTGETKATPLSLAIENNGKEEVTLLLQLGANLKLVDSSIISAYQPKVKTVDTQPSSSQFFLAPNQDSTSENQGEALNDKKNILATPLSN